MRGKSEYRGIPLFTPLIALLALAFLPRPALADIFQWQPIEPNPTGLLNYIEQSTTLCPDGAGISAGPSADLANLDLTMAYLPFVNLKNANLNSTNLTNADFFGATLINADLTNAVIVGAVFTNITDGAGITVQQLTSTASYKAKNLQGVGLSQNDLTGIDLSGQNLSNANLEVATLTNANLTNAAVVGTDFGGVIGFTSQQLTSTASYKSLNLQGIGLESNHLDNINLAAQNLTGANLGSSALAGASLANANLTNASLVGATLTNADITNAVITGADFGYAPGFTIQQLTSTSSYKAGNLRGIGLEGLNLGGINLSQQNLSNANITNVNLINANLSSSSLLNANLSFSDMRGANLTNANTSNAIFTNTILPDGSVDGLQLLSEAGLTVSSSLTIRNYHAPQGGGYTGGIHISSQMNLGHQTSLKMIFDGPQWNSTISFDPNIPITIASNNGFGVVSNDSGFTITPTGVDLDLEIDSSVAPSSLIGDSFRLFDWTGVTPSGQFYVTTELPADEYQWDTTNLYTNGTLTLNSLPEPTTLALAGVVAAGLLARRKPRRALRARKQNR